MFARNHSSFISITFFGLNFRCFNSPTRNSSKICGDQLFQGPTSLTLALKIGLRYRMGAVTLNLFPGYSLGRIAWAHSGF